MTGRVASMRRIDDGHPPAGGAPPRGAERGTGRSRRRTRTPRRPRTPEEAGFVVLPAQPPQGLLRRMLTTQRHLLGLALGGIIARARSRRAAGELHGLRGLVLRTVAWLARPFVRRDLVDQPFPVQFRRRLELLGPTYIKLGQILSLREDLLPQSVTRELRNLLDRLPVVAFDTFVGIVERELQRPWTEMFAEIDPIPLGSASIAQIHRAVTVEGDDVVLKVVKPGIRETLHRDARLLRVLGALLQPLLGRYQPRRIIDEFCDYTLREADLRREADNAEAFAGNFRDVPGVVFPAIHRRYSSASVLTMEYLDGLRPDRPEAQALPLEQRRRIVDLGAMAIIRMLYEDGFFHADLHPANLLILPGPKVGFIDLGMVGRLDPELRRGMLYYYYALVTGDAESAAKYLSMVASPGPGGDPNGFRREVMEISSRWRHAATFEGFSLAQLILESVQRGGRFRMYFPVEMVLMVKALITYEGVGHLLLPGLDVAEISRAHTRRIFIAQFSPMRLVHEGVREAPDVMDALVRVPLLVTEGLRVLERATRQPSENPLAGVRGTLIAGFCLVAGAILMAFHGPWPLWGALFVVAIALAVRKGE